MKLDHSFSHPFDVNVDTAFPSVLKGSDLRLVSPETSYCRLEKNGGSR